MANTYNASTTNINLPYPPTNGTVLTTSVTGSSWTSPNTNFNDGTDAVMVIPHGSKTVEIAKAATLDVKGNVRINGIDLEERLNTIEKMLMIPERDVILETKHPRLKKLYDEYMTALEEYRTWERLKGSDDD